MSYAEKDKAAELAGSDISSGDITDEELNQIDDYIDLNIYQPGFQEHTADEYYDIDKDDQDRLVLKNIPIISITELIHDASSDTPKTIHEDSYAIEQDTGVLKLITTKSITGNSISEFNEGHNVVRVKYTYGYSSVPGDITRFANMLLARWKKVQNNVSNAGIKTSVTIGNYRESRSQWSLFNTDLDDLLMKLEKQIIMKYAVGV